MSFMRLVNMYCKNVALYVLKYSSLMSENIALDVVFSNYSHELRQIRNGMCLTHENMDGCNLIATNINHDNGRLQSLAVPNI
jgi:hypothetical protein